ncbi:hypothetical protein [uncultured Mailhella sp.]|uniref:hypothetical protein n=1 Tax=uncultured Mailhella sp. TaxID=1981031 RepID=UPI003208479B
MKEAPEALIALFGGVQPRTGAHPEPLLFFDFCRNLYARQEQQNTELFRAHLRTGKVQPF